ncbi:unnamed protein product [Cochlearia groenlandica]
MSSTLPNYDVFLNFRGLDTGRNFISFLHKELDRRSIRTFKEDNESSRSCSSELVKAIEESKFAVVVISKNYAASSRCLDELVRIMESFKEGLITVMPVFYDVDPCHLRRNSGEIAKQFKEHEAKEDSKKVFLWREALIKLSNISGDCSSKWENDSKLVDEICDRISKKRMITTITRIYGNILEGIDTHMKSIRRLLDLKSNNKNVRVVGIWARGSNGRSALAKSIYHDIDQHFERRCYLENVKKITDNRDMLHLREALQTSLQVEHSSSFKNQKILLVANEVDNVKQLDALSEDFNTFGQGSIVIITSQDKQIFDSFGIKLIYEVEQPRFQKVHELLRQIAFKKKGIVVAFESTFCGAKDIVIESLCCLPHKSRYSKL